MYFDNFTKQALQELHRYRAVIFSPTAIGRKATDFIY